ncbi:cysteine dioxygenase type I [Polychaeton citri CBS 116435]|uniref:Cysteine dioxygenase n=1 Tax=Polychaeton citri CBS 116435 TaxID=1314669 RepID=A0A9P4Q0G1_9PEZI|nr:cysteine dioxygenase type I [Polychaeton citri CBS 116435]
MASKVNSSSLAMDKKSSPPPRDSARGTPEFEDGFNQLVKEINTILGPSNGIDSAGVDVEELKSVMDAYNSNENEWGKFAFADQSRPYTRNLVDNCNGKSNLLILVWTPGKSSPIHDHANAHCVMKILKGRLQETIYGWPCEVQAEDGSVNACNVAAGDVKCPSTQHNCSASVEGSLEPHALNVKRNTIYEKEGVTYMSDRLGLHRIGNPSQDQLAVSLHLYTPPNAAKHGCHIFEEATGKKSHVQQCHFYSEFGTKM